MEPSISAQLDCVRFCNLVPPIPFPRFYPDSHLPVLSSIQPSNFRSSFERQTRQHLVTVVVLVHPPRGCSAQCLRSALSKPRRLPSSSKRAISLFPSRSLPVKWAISFLCTTHRKSYPWMGSLIVSSLLSSADFQSQADLKVLPPAISPSPQVTSVVMKVGR